MPRTQARHLRFFTVLLILPISAGLALPNPAFALRQSNAGERSPVRRALQEDLGHSAGLEGSAASHAPIPLLADVVLDWVTVKPVHAYREVPCALCGRSHHEPVGVVRINGQDFHIVKCRHDGLLWLNPQPDKDYYTQLYSERFFAAPHDLAERVGLQYNRPGVLARRWRDARLQVEEWTQYGGIASPGALLEVGGGAAFLSREAMTKGWSVLHVEMSDYAATLSKASGVPTYTGTLEEAVAHQAVPDKSCDLVAAYALIEHLPDPNGFLEHVRRVLKDGGMLAARIPVTPPAGPRLALVEHVYHYTPGTFTRLLRNHGFVVTHQHYSGTFGDDRGNKSDVYTFFARKIKVGEAPGPEGAGGLEETPTVFMAPDAATYHGPVRVVMKIGGTTTAAQAAIAEGFVGARSVGPTLSQEPDEAKVVQGFVNVLAPIIEERGPDNIEGVELAAPGWFDLQMRSAGPMENIAGLQRLGFSYQESVAEALARRYAGRRDPRLGPIRVRVVHDGTASGMLEVGPRGTVRGAKRVLVVDVGTGIATRMMIDGRPFLGGEKVQDFHNEGPNLLMFTGHRDHPNYEYVAMRTHGLPPAMVGPTLPNGQPNPWLSVETLEQRTSGPGVARYAAQLAREPRRGDADFARWADDLTERAGPGGLDALTAAQVGEAARDGNPLARRAIRERMRELGIGLAVFVVESNRLFEEFGWPDHVVFGGGVSHAESELFLEAIRGGFADRLARYITEDYPADLANRLVLSKYVAVDETARQMTALFPTEVEMAAYREKLQAAGLEAPAQPTALVQPTPTLDNQL